MKYPDTWIEEPVFDSGEVSKRASDRSSMTSAVPKTWDAGAAAAVAEFLANRTITRPTQEEQRASDVRANERGQGRKHIANVMKGWASHRAARALPTKAEVEAMEAGCGTWAVNGDRSLKEKGDTKVAFPKALKIPEPVSLSGAPILTPGRCANCGEPIPPKMREKGARCCCKNCSQTYRRRRKAMTEANRVFAPQPAKVEAKPTVERDLTPVEYFEDMLKKEEWDEYWDAQEAEDAQSAKREAESDAMLEALSKRVPKPICSRRNEAP
jgi:hypothetical protein